MSDEPSLEPLPADVAQALEVERTRDELPASSQSRLVSRIEASDSFQVATTSRPMNVAGHQSASGELVTSLRRPIGLVLLLAGVVWGATMGASVVALMQRAVVPPVASEERTDLQRARAALSLHKPKEALVMLEAHARTYPTSVAADERESLAVQALVDDGQAAAAAARAASFRVNYGKSELLPVVEQLISGVEGRRE